VAGLAALAVVLVTNVVDDTSEQISGSESRGTAARLAAIEIMQDVLSEAKVECESLNNPNPCTSSTTALSSSALDMQLMDKLEQLNRKYQKKCENLRVIYSDISGISFEWKDGVPRDYAQFQDSSRGRAPTCTVSS
jgi:hypothetical protein